MDWLFNLLWNALLYICLIGVAVAGVFTGKKLRDRKEKKENLN